MTTSYENQNIQDQKNREVLSRRNFQKLSLAAVGGILAGCQPGCEQTPPNPAPGNNAATTQNQTSTDVVDKETLILDEPHVCRGLNTCKGQGRSKENACAGQGTCASIADQVCGGHNACKGQGGCGADPGMNSCKGKGGCHVPLMDEAWKTARAAFESAMKKQGKDVGAAPPKAAM